MTTTTTITEKNITDNKIKNYYYSVLHEWPIMCVLSIFLEVSHASLNRLEMRANFETVSAFSLFESYTSFKIFECHKTMGFLRFHWFFRSFLTKEEKSGLARTDVLTKSGL